MNILVSTRKTQGNRNNDFCFVPDGELVMFGFACDNGSIDDNCGCRRSMIGIDCKTATTTMMVVEDSMTIYRLHELFIASHKAAGWPMNDEISVMFFKDVLEIQSAIKDLPVGTVMEYRGKFQKR